MDFKIEAFKAERLDRGLINSDMQDAHTAIVKFDTGDWLGVSRYHDEDYWVVDCRFGDNGFPYFSHGTGSRVTSKLVIKEDNPIHEALNSLM